jgi:hypothetical protein
MQLYHTDNGRHHQTALTAPVADFLPMKDKSIRSHRNNPLPVFAINRVTTRRRKIVNSDYV